MKCAKITFQNVAALHSLFLSSNKFHLHTYIHVPCARSRKTNKFHRRRNEKKKWESKALSSSKSDFMLLRFLRFRFNMLTPAHSRLARASSQFFFPISANSQCSETCQNRRTGALRVVNQKPSKVITANIKIAWFQHNSKCTFLQLTLSLAHRIEI